MAVVGRTKRPCPAGSQELPVPSSRGAGGPGQGGVIAAWPRASREPAARHEARVLVDRGICAAARPRPEGSASRSLEAPLGPWRGYKNGTDNDQHNYTGIKALLAVEECKESGGLPSWHRGSLEPDRVESIGSFCRSEPSRTCLTCVARTQAFFVSLRPVAV